MFQRVVSCVLVVVVSLTFSAAALAEEQQSCWIGTVGKNLQVTMSLDPDAKGTFNGTYSYNRYGKSIFLSGKAADHDQLTLTEMGENGDKPTGKFTGTLSDSGAAYAGKWTSADGKRSLPFVFWKAANGVELKAAAKQGDVSVRYPQFTAGTAFCKAINDREARDARKTFDAGVADYRKIDDPDHRYETTITFEVLHADDRIVSLLFLNYEYSGGAHGNCWFAAENYAWRDGKLVTLELAQLFDGKSPYIKRLADLCTKDLKRQHASWPEQMTFTAKSPPIFNITSAGLRFTFAPYEVGSYAEGTYTVIIPYDQIADLIPPTSPLTPLLPASVAKRN